MVKHLFLKFSSRRQPAASPPAAIEPPQLTDTYIRAEIENPRHKDWTGRQPLMQRCLDALEQGQPNAFCSFLVNYLVFKRRIQELDDIGNDSLDNGLVALVADPVIQLLEKQKKPAVLLQSLCADMSAYYKQQFLDIVLRRACRRNSWSIIDVLLDAGADVNTGNCRPTINALDNNHIKLAATLIIKSDVTLLAHALNNSNEQTRQRFFIAKNYALQQIGQAQTSQNAVQLPAPDTPVLPPPKASPVKKTPTA